MEFAKTFCKPGACIAVTPVGLQTVLQYNENGLLQKVLIGFGSDLDNDRGTYTITDEGTYKKLFESIRGRVPVKISTTGGTTWIYGVMYSDRIPSDDGVLPDSLFKSYIDDIVKGESYSFYAGYIHSLAAAFQGPVVIRNYLSMAGFNDLPQVLVPVTLTDNTIEGALHSTKTPFNKNFIAGFFVFEDMKCRYAPLGLKQITVTKDPEIEIGPDGCWKGTVVGANESIVFNYSAIKHHQVGKGATLLLQQINEHHHDIISTRVGSDAELVKLGVGAEVKCPVCGKVCRVGADDAAYRCDDPHCVSHMYTDTQKMLKALKLAELSFEEYKKAVDQKDIQCLTDVLALPQYKDEKIQVTLASALYAVIPFTPFELLEKFANKCNNKVETVVYYIENPLRIETDLDITEVAVARLVKWLEDPYNITTLTTIFDIVEIEEKEQKFDGAPIFRGNKIAITGRFKRGDLPEIEAILRSYSAEVTTSINVGDDLPDVVVTGGTAEGISGQVIQKAKVHGIPIYEEDDFFIRYEIDQDLASNLL